MTTVFPGALDTFVNPIAGDYQNSVTVDHHLQHANANDAIAAVQAVVFGIRNDLAASKIIPGATSWSLRNTADSRDNLIITDAGNATLWGSLKYATAASKMIPGATSYSIRNNADTLTNFSITDAGVFSLTPQDVTGSGTFIALGTLANTTRLAANNTTVNFVQVRQSFKGTGGAPNGNSARVLQSEAHWTDATNGVGTLSGGYFFAYHDAATTDVSDLFGCIGRAYITSTGQSSTGFWGTRGDFNFDGAGSAVKAVAVYGHQGDQFAGSSITTAAMLAADAVNWNTTTVQDAYGALIGSPASATGFNIGVSIGPPLASTAFTAGLVVWGSGAVIKGTPSTLFADTSNTNAYCVIQAGDHSAANDTLALLYFYRGSAVQGYVGYDSNTSNVIAGHTKVVGDLILGSDSKLLVDGAGQIWSNGKITATTALNATATAIASGNLPTMMTLTSAAHTGLNNTATQEVFISLAQTKTFTGGGANIATMYGVNIGSPTYAAAAAQTIDKASTLTIQGAPAQGTNMTITATYALEVRSGAALFSGDQLVGAGATGMVVGFNYIPSAAGAPTGAPTNLVTGRVAMYYDETNNFLYIRKSGGAWVKSTVYA